VAAEAAAHELPNLPLEDALELVQLYAERGSPKCEKAALRWLERYPSDGSPTLRHCAEITASLDERESRPRELPAVSRSETGGGRFVESRLGRGRCRVLSGSFPPLHVEPRYKRPACVRSPASIDTTQVVPLGS
jgi:hypothetical protein